MFVNQLCLLFFASLWKTLVKKILQLKSLIQDKYLYAEELKLIEAKSREEITLEKEEEKLDETTDLLESKRLVAFS